MGLLLRVAVSPGRYTGPVRVIRTDAELCQLRAGAVLVCPTTHSSWTVAFSQVGALVADGGSILSHPSRLAKKLANLVRHHDPREVAPRRAAAGD